MLPRPSVEEQIEAALARSPITALLGPRQCGKTTLARALAAGQSAAFFDLEDPQDRARLTNARWALEQVRGFIVLDEIQLAPDLFPILRVLVDADPEARKFLLLGSASPSLLRQASESLAGRVEFIEMTPFDLSEIPSGTTRDLWRRGGFPRSYLSPDEEASVAWREGFIRTFLERDIPQLGITIPSAALRRFWAMLAHVHGQLLNSSELGRSLGLSDKTIRSYLDILTGTYMIRQLQPWHENLAKRQVKAPKIYFRDSGLLHHLLGIESQTALESHPKLGASWEGFALETFLRLVRPSQAYFWSTYSGAELDLLFFKDGRRYGVEFKYAQAPGLTRSMQSARDSLNLDHLWIVTPGETAWPLAPGVTVLGLECLPRQKDSDS